MIPGIPPMLVPAGCIIAYSGKIKRPDVPLQPVKNPVPLPPGIIYEGVLNASGWLVCDGSLLNAKDYPALFYAIGYTYNTTGKKPWDEEILFDLTGITFNIPDYRGYFLRGITDPKQVNDPDASIRHEVYSKDNKSTDVGSLQSDAFQEHTHTYSGLGTALSTPIVSASQASLAAVKVKTEKPIDPDTKTSLHETRPLNISVYYLIKCF